MGRLGYNEKDSWGERKPMTAFWQAKIWGLLHDPQLKSLYCNKREEGIWQEVLRHLGNDHPSDLQNQIKLADFIAAASDRPSWDQAGDRGSVDYQDIGLSIKHLLSGAQQYLKIEAVSSTDPKRDSDLKETEAEIIRHKLFPLLEGLSDEEKVQKAFWWLWRCLPEEIAQKYGDKAALLPADTRIPDCSVWSHNSIVAALAGCLSEQFTNSTSRPYLVIYSFTPVQDLISASRKMQDFWAGSWLLHYLSAKVCWKWACEYGPDTLIYPSLYAQPLIDQWLNKRWVDLGIKPPPSEKLLTAGFPNVLVAVLPESAVLNAKRNALSFADETLRQEWLHLGDKVFEELPRKEAETKSRLWDSWLKQQWQTYWTALPLGAAKPLGASDSGDVAKVQDESIPLSRGQGKLLTRNKLPSPAERQQIGRMKQDFMIWVKQQNDFCQTLALPDNALNLSTLQWNTEAFEERHPSTYPTLAELSTYSQFNVGLWWPEFMARLRHNLQAVKSARTWQLPSAFGPRSTISGIGPVLHPQQYDKNGKPVDWCSEHESKHFWQERGWFDGREQLNATEVVKRGLKKILPKELGLSEGDLSFAYPDLTAGVAGWLKTSHDRGENMIAQYTDLCQKIIKKHSWTETAAQEKWGIPWIVNHHPDCLNSRLLNAGWLIEDFTPPSDRPLTEARRKEETKAELDKLSGYVESAFTSDNQPTDWYVLAAGDGDDMSAWLKGNRLKCYAYYIADGWPKKAEQWDGFENFLNQKKRMGPATHSALSRALLDFSNQLVPYLTEERYAGRLIYSGGDDVLAYTNLWEWDSWLWDIQQCFKGQRDPNGRTKLPEQHEDLEDEFISEGDYWQWKSDKRPKSLAARPLFTMGHQATISFGIVIANQGVPLAIALGNLREAEEEAKAHFCVKLEQGKRLKNAVQVRVLYGNGNILKATTKFDTFAQWRSLLNCIPKLEPALFEQSAQLWEQHPVPVEDAITPWTQAFCNRREALSQEDSKQTFQTSLASFLKAMWQTSSDLNQDRDREIQNWLKLAAFVLRKREIKLRGDV